MNVRNILLVCFLACASVIHGQATLYSEEFSDEAGVLNTQSIYLAGSADRVSWGVSGNLGPNLSSGTLKWNYAPEACSWVSETVYVAGYSALKLNVDISESGTFDSTDSLNVIIIEDGVERLVSSQLANDFGTLSISNEPCTASVSLQVLIHVHTSWFTDLISLEEVSITGTADYTDIDLDGVDDDTDVCIDMDGDGTCDNVDSEIMLMEEDFSSYAIGTGLGSSSTDEAGLAFVQGVSAAGGNGWALLGEDQKNAVTVRNSGGEAYLQYRQTGSGFTDTTTVTWMSRCFDLSHITDPRVRFQASEITDIADDNKDGKFRVKLIEDGVEREVISVSGAFTSVDSIVSSTAVNKLTVVILGYAQENAILKLDGVSVYGGYCQTGKDLSGDCQDIGCTDPRACSYSSIAITSDVTKCKYLGDACDDGDATNFSDRYENAGDGTCDCQGYALQAIYLENFAANGAAQGGLDYGYEGSQDLDGDGTQNEDNAALETEWTLDFESASYGTGTALVPSPFFFATKVESGDTIMKAFNTMSNYIRWTSRAVNVSAFDSVYVSGVLMGFGNQGAGDYARFGWEEGTTLQSPLLAEITGSSSETLTANEKVTSAGGSIRLQVEIENQGSSDIAAHGFDDMAVSGLKRGCTDPDASNYDASPSDGFLARSDDGSCQFDWTKVYSRKDGDFDGQLWAGKPCSEAGYTCGSSTLYIDVNTVTENGTRHAVISANTVITVPTGGYSLGELTLESGAELAIPEGEVLTVNGAFHHQGGTISGTGRLLVKGEMELAAGLTSMEVHDFTFGSGGQLNLADGDTLRVKGDLTIDDGSAIAGRIELTGTSAQSVAGLDLKFDTLRIANAAGVTFAANAQIDGVLDIDAGIVEMDGKVLTFSSDANGTGMLDMIASGASLEDNSTGSQVAASAIVKRYIAPDGDGVTFSGFSSYASPLSGVTMTDLNDITGFYLAGFPGTDWPGSFSTVKFWDESEGEYLDPTHLGTPLDTLGGVWIALAGFQTPTMSTEGVLRSHVSGSSQSFPLTRTEGVSLEGWNFIMNPYQASLDWSVIYAANSGIQDQYAVFDTQTWGYKRYSSDGTTFTSAPSHIGPGQSFWVNLEGGNTTGTLSIPTSAISTDAADLPDFIRNDVEDGLAQLELEIENPFGLQKALFSFGDGGALSPVSGRDLSFISSDNVKVGQLAVWSEDERYVKKMLPMEATVDLFVKSRANLTTTLRVTAFTAESEVCVTITDTETGEVMVSRVGEELTFTLPEHEAEAGRFVLDVVPSARVSARAPSCPEMGDGRVEVTVGQEPTNVLLTDGGDNVLEQFIGAVGTAYFTDLTPGEYGLVVAGPDMKCGTERRSFEILPGEQPELLGLDWNVPACNAGEVTVDFELYGSGDFNASLRLGNSAVWSSLEEGGEVAIGGLMPGTYALELEHICLEETIVLDLFDPNAVAAEAVYDAVVVMDPVGGTALEALPACVGEDAYHWIVDGEVLSENEPLFHPVETVGEHVVQLEAWNNACADVVDLEFLVVNWNEARVLDSPVTVREDATHWTLVFGRDLGQTQMLMMDAAGRTVWTGQVIAEEGFVYRVERPATAGTYLMQVVGNGGRWGIPMLNAGF